MTQTEMVTILARAMTGKTGEALRQFMAGIFGDGLNQMLEGNPTEYNIGRLKGYREIANALEGMPNAVKLMQGGEK